jgi:hypothetical protein
MCIYVRHYLRMDSESIWDMKLGNFEWRFEGYIDVKE